MTHRFISSVVMWCSSSCRLFSFIEFSVMNRIFMVPILIAVYANSRCLSTAAFVKEMTSSLTSSLVLHATLTMVRFCITKQDD
jgi:hypothetical protein